MPLCAFRSPRPRHDETAVENSFIREYMPKSPDGYVKVYLFGLMQCQCGAGESSVSSFARALFMQEGEIVAAFKYWQKLGLVSLNESPAFSVMYERAQNALPRDVSQYAYAELNAHLAELFAPSALSPADLGRIYDWVEIFGIEEGALPALISYGRSKMKNIARSSASGQVSYIDKIARQWADEGVKSPEQAESWLKEQEGYASAIAALMRKLGMRRAPTASERGLFQGWRDMGFDEKAITAASERMTGAYSPNFKYLDEIISALNAQGKRTEQDIRSEQTEQLCSEALGALGLKDPSPAPSQMESYRALLGRGFDHERILLACEVAKKRGRTTLLAASELLKGWEGQGLSSLKQIRAYEQRRGAYAEEMAEAYRRMGLSKKVSEADIDLYARWHKDWGMPGEVILLAAERSLGAAAPYRFMQKMMENWHEGGINTVAKAKKAETEKAAPGRKKDPALEYSQRTYAPGELDQLFEEL